MIPEWISNNISPEEYFKTNIDCLYLVKLTNNKIIKATRSNNYWFGMWRWLKDNEIKEWKIL